MTYSRLDEEKRKQFRIKALRLLKQKLIQIEEGVEELERDEDGKTLKEAKTKNLRIKLGRIYIVLGFYREKY